MVVVVLVVAAMGLAIFVGFRDVYRARLASACREEGLAAYKDGDYKTAMEKLGYALSREKNDLEGLLAFAGSRSRVEELNNRILQTRWC